MLERAALDALNHLLQGAAWASARLAPFAGRLVRLSLPPLRLDLAVNGAGLFEESSAESFDVEIALPADAPLLALRGAETLFKAARISGQAEFADALGFVLRNLRWDYEEDLSRYLGDIAAHRVAGFLAAMGDWQRQAGRNLAENIAEYLTEENPTLAKAAAVASFSRDVEQFREELRRLEQRLARLSA